MYEFCFKKSSFITTTTWFVERGVKADSMLRADHQYPKEINAIIRKNQQQAGMCQVRRYSRDNNEFEVQEIFSPHDHCLPVSFTVRLNDWWCDCGHFQALRLPCHHVIVVCSFSHVNLTLYIHPVYSLYNINKAYEIQFHPVKNKEYWSTYTRPNFIPDPNMRRRIWGRPPTNRIHNEMDQPNPNRRSKCSYCRNEGHDRGNCLVVNNLLFYPILVYFYYVILYYLIYFIKLIYCRNKNNYKYNRYNFYI